MGKGKTLIVDDEADMRLLLFLTIMHADHGLRVVGEAASGEAALIIQPPSLAPANTSEPLE